ncbi:MAG TPA: hypothetical protein VHE35_15735 [Kofleriaceae bacterium]|nr:hypothetical protein [Kofleriaceae bacterium]
MSLLTLVDLAELGPVDASLVHLAKDQVAHGNVALVFTGDNKVRKRCVKEGIDCPFPVDILNRENTI